MALWKPPETGSGRDSGATGSLWEGTLPWAQGSPWVPRALLPSPICSSALSLVSQTPCCLGQVWAGSCP